MRGREAMACTLAEEVRLIPRSIAPEDCKPDPQWLMPDEMWRRIEPLLPPETPKGGRPVADRRRTLEAIFHVLRTGCQWKALPRSLGSGSTARAYFQRLVALGVFEQLWRVALEVYDKTRGIQWQWQAMDGTMTKAPLAARR